MSGKNFSLLMAALIGLLLIFLIAGCNSEKRIMKGVSKGLAFYPEQTIAKVRLLSPCVTIGSSFSTDSVAYKASLDSLHNSRVSYESLIRGLEQFQHDTAENKNCPTILKELELANKKMDYQEEYIIDLTDKFNSIEPIVINRVDTVLDKSETTLLNFELLAAKKETTDTKGELIAEKKYHQQAREGRNSWRKWFFILLGVTLLSWVPYFLKLKKSFSIKSLIS